MRGVLVRVQSGEGSTLIRRPVQRLYLLEVRGTVQADSPANEETPEEVPSPVDDVENQGSARPQRRAALQSRERVQAWTRELDSDIIIHCVWTMVCIHFVC